MQSLIFIWGFIILVCTLMLFKNIKKPASLVVDLTGRSYILIKVLSNEKNFIFLKPVPYTPFNLKTYLSGDTYTTADIELTLAKQTVINRV